VNTEKKNKEIIDNLTLGDRIIALSLKSLLNLARRTKILRSLDQDLWSFVKKVLDLVAVSRPFEIPTWKKMISVKAVFLID